MNKILVVILIIIIVFIVLFTLACLKLAKDADKDMEKKE